MLRAYSSVNICRRSRKVADALSRQFPVASVSLKAASIQASVWSSLPQKTVKFLRALVVSAEMNRLWDPMTEALSMTFDLS